MLIQIQFKNRIRWTIKKIDADDNATDKAGNDQSMFILRILEKMIHKYINKLEF